MGTMHYLLLLKQKYSNLSTASDGKISEFAKFFQKKLKKCSILVENMDEMPKRQQILSNTGRGGQQKK